MHARGRVEPLLRELDVQIGYNKQFVLLPFVPRNIIGVAFSLFNKAVPILFTMFFGVRYTLLFLISDSNDQLRILYLIQNGSCVSKFVCNVHL